jgi:Na+:H+ antiporter, NhaA family
MDNNPKYDLSSPPPESWLPARRLVLKVVGPIERFMHVEAGSGIILLAAALIALVWANSPYGHSYDELWHTPFRIGVGPWTIEESLHFWINDFLMAIFFFVVGLEIKREIVEGALSEIRRAALPVAAAIGGMVVPAGIFIAFNWGGPASRGWGVPMATDIAFAVGVLTLLGSRVPAALRILLLALAIIDDIGAILVIAIFYSSGIQPDALIIIAAGIFGILALTWIGVRPGLVWVLPPLVVWGGMLRLGVHPTIAGVVVGLMVPLKSWFGRDRFLQIARSALDEFQQRAHQANVDERELVEPLNILAQARREALSPAKRIESALHPWVAFVIMPVFALANAGVHVAGLDFGTPGSTGAMLGVGLGLAVGKCLGIVGFSWISVRVGLCVLPPGVNWKGLFVLGAAGGIGFTMAIFIAELAFAQTPLLNPAKLAVLIGTALSGAIALASGAMLLQAPGVEEPQPTESDLEASADYWTLGSSATRDGLRARM